MLAPNEEWEFHLSIVDNDLKQPGLKATEMSRKALKRARAQRDAEAQDLEKRKLAEKERELKEEKKQKRDVQCSLEDFWTVNEHFITRHHRRPRTDLFVPTEEDCPIPLKWIDVMRFTHTSLPEFKLKGLTITGLKTKTYHLKMNGQGILVSPF